MFGRIESIARHWVLLLAVSLGGVGFVLAAPAGADGGHEDNDSATEDSATGADSSNNGGTQIYIVPMVGQFGTDILPEIYAPIIEDIKQVDPDVIVFRLKTAALEGNEGFIDIIEGDNNARRGPERDATDYNMVRDLRRQFGIELKAYDQVLWVENANGILGIMAFGWKDMVMSPEATIGDLAVWFRMMAAAAGGPNVFGKYFDAMLGILEGVAERGGWTQPDRQPLWESMTDPRMALSTTWVGRRAIFYPNLKGDFIIDASAVYPPTLLSIDAEMAEDLLVTKGIVRDVDDIGLLMGWPRYQIVGDAKDVVDTHRKEWQELLKRAEGLWKAYQRGIKLGDLPGMSTAIRALRQLLATERRNPAMTMAFQQKRIPSGVQIQILLDQAIERQAEIRRNPNSGRGGGGGGGVGPGGGGGVSPGGPRPG